VAKADGTNHVARGQFVCIFGPMFNVDEFVEQCANETKKSYTVRKINISLSLQDLMQLVAEDAARKRGVAGIASGNISFTIFNGRVIGAGASLYVEVPTPPPLMVLVDGMLDELDRLEHRQMVADCQGGW
jgi:hypothetical protein